MKAKKKLNAAYTYNPGTGLARYKSQHLEKGDIVYPVAMEYVIGIVEYYVVRIGVTKRYAIVLGSQLKPITQP